MVEGSTEKGSIHVLHGGTRYVHGRLSLVESWPVTIRNMAAIYASGSLHSLPAHLMAVFQSRYHFLYL